MNILILAFLLGGVEVNGLICHTYEDSMISGEQSCEINLCYVLYNSEYSLTVSPYRSNGNALN